jgi:hypothetical protein
MPKQKQSKKGLPKRTGKRKGRIAAYFEVTYLYRKLLRMYKNGAAIAMMRAWADDFRCPSGSSAVHALVRFGKDHGLNVNQIDG